MSTMSKEGECSLAKGHGEINGSKEVMGTPTKASFKVEMICVTSEMLVSSWNMWGHPWLKFLGCKLKNICFMVVNLLQGVLGALNVNNTTWNVQVCFDLGNFD